MSTMECRSLEITVASAKGLKKVKHLSKMDVYVTVKLSGDPAYTGQLEHRTHVAKDGGTSPTWSNSAFTFTIREALANANRLVITFKITCDRSNKDIGEAHVPVRDLLDHVGADKAGQRYITYKVKKPNGKPRGEINFFYRFGGQMTRTGGAGGFAVHAPPLPTHNPAPYPWPRAPALAQLLPSWGSFSYHGCSPSPPPSYSYHTVAPPHMPPAGYPTVARPMGYQAEGPPAGYPPVDPPQVPPVVYPPRGAYGF
ncbi:PREDICTED: protein SRC2 homolog [Tarenaya hassleriana]|uniref:protein SRC2 homolog n=1 Tax=Tarenaya hassleriana TaxID=28532 RepID=UPI00053CA8E7|nr:PREDICTED: protein SRC2 homolog [Tarenaya hassleriana]